MDRTDSVSGKLARDSLNTGGLLTGKLYKETKNKPLVRIVFDTYCLDDKTIDVGALQEMCYDFGVYYSLQALRLAVTGFASSGDDVMSYDDFMVWWRSNEKFR